MRRSNSTAPAGFRHRRERLLTLSQQPEAPEDGEETSLHTWSTRDLPPRQQRDFWADAICATFLELSPAAVGPPEFRGQLVASRCGALGVNRVDSDPFDVSRSTANISRSSKDVFYLMSMPGAPWRVSQREQRVDLGSGDLVLVDAREPFEIRFPRAGTLLAIELPTKWLESWIPAPDALVGRSLDTASPWCATLGAFVRAFTPEYAAGCRQLGPLLADQLGGLISLVAADTGFAPSPARSRLSMLAREVLRALHERHATPGLTVTHISRQLEVSERTIHRAMCTQRTTFSMALLEIRMKAAFRMLTDPRFDRLSVGEIGRRVGIADGSHFARQYRKHFGIPPGSSRAPREPGCRDPSDDVTRMGRLEDG